MALSPSLPRRHLAGNVHSLRARGLSVQASAIGSAMNSESQIRFTAGVLAVFTVAAITLAWINLRKESSYPVPTDGIRWVERGQQVIADQVEPGGPGARAGVEPGDRLLSVNGRPVT